MKNHGIVHIIQEKENGKIGNDLLMIYWNIIRDWILDEIFIVLY